MRYLHRRCVSKQALQDALDENEALREQSGDWERRFKETAAAGRDIVVERDDWRTRARNGTAIWKGVTEERDEARYWLAAAESRLVDLRGAGVLTRDDIRSAIEEWFVQLPDGEGEPWLPDGHAGALIDTLLAAQREAAGSSARRAQTAIKAATEGVTQEVGE